ncbi:MAG: PAS domain-containing protein [Clostridia bacterium]|nr:PAS domain-containing protein [Clostridia bacterium]
MSEAQMFRQLIESLPNGVLVFDLDGSVLYSNTAAREILQLHERHPSQELDERIRTFIGSARDGETYTVEIGAHTVQLVYHDRMDNGMRCGAILYLTIVDNLRKQEFTANVSHELKTPLTSISGYAEMIENGMARPEDVKSFAGRINREARRMLKLVTDIIKLTELNATQIMEQAEEVDLYQLAQENIETLESAAQSRNTTLSLSGETSVVTGNRSLLSELIYNLIDNAIRYNRDNGSVSVRVHHHVLTVRDTGIGIPKAHQNRIFERFYRVDKSRSKATGGTGLGLAIVRQICEQHHAQIRLESREGVGTEISVTFPTFHED